MPITNTGDRVARKSQVASRKSKILRVKKQQNFKFFAWFIILLLINVTLSACIQKKGIEKARNFEKLSDEYYERAIAEYEELISESQDSDKFYLELGKLYYRHKDYEKAVEAFLNTDSPEARKLTAVSYFRLGDYTGALELFNKQEIAEDEYLYYYGLTCESLNLFDRATELYSRIKEEKYLSLAGARIEAIEKKSRAGSIDKIDPKTSQILAAAPNQQDYPQAGALILWCDEKMEVTAENTMTNTMHYIVKIINERGKREFSEARIDYDSTFEKIELEYARTIKPDGTVTEIGSRHIRDVSKYLNFPLYSNVRVFIISFPEVVEGCSIEYKVKIQRNRLVNEEDFIVSYPVQSSEPIIKAKFAIDLPAERTLHIQARNVQYNDFSARLEPRIEKNKDKTVYSWEFDNIPQIIPEREMPPNTEINPSLLISTFSSWQEVYEWWWQLARSKIKADVAIKNELGRLIKTQESDEDKIRKIYNFCAQKIRYVAVGYGQAGHEPHAAEDIYKNKYGDCKDQAILLVTMLREAGFSSWPVLIPTKGAYNLDKDFPAIFFNHCIAAVSVNDEIVFLDPTAQTCAFGDLPAGDVDRNVLIFTEEGYKIEHIPLYLPEHNLIRQKLYIKVNKDESIDAKKSILTHGMYDQGQRYWMLHTPPELIEEELRQSIQNISIGAVLKNYDIKNLDNLNKPIELDYKFHGPEYFTSAGSNRIMPQLATVETSLVAKAKRRYPIDFAILDLKETSLEIELPKEMQIKFLPQDINEENRWLRYIVNYEYAQDKIYFQQSVKLKNSSVSVEEYNDFKVFLEDLAKKTKQRIILKRAQQ